MTPRRDDGANVERAACRHLEAAGLRLLAANVGYRGGELDLVMLDGDDARRVVVFVEVRHRRSQAFGGGAASVDAGKRRRLVLAAQQFLAGRRDLSDLPCRFDVVAATGDPATPTLDWIRDAFRADD
nr:YraN family protein [Luteimonas deserti]